MGKVKNLIIGRTNEFIIVRKITKTAAELMESTRRFVNMFAIKKRAKMFPTM